MPFIVVTSFAVLNMFIGVIVSSIEADSEDHRREHMAALEARLMERLGEIEQHLLTAKLAESPLATDNGGHSHDRSTP
mgnify:CR=1 FL=1